MKKIYFTVTFFLLIGILPIAGNAINYKNKTFLFVFTEELKITIEKKDVSSENSNNGYIKLQVTGGTAPYSITYFDPYTEHPINIKSDKLTLENLKSGEYLFVVQDGTSKTITREVNIEVR